jgi:4-hydroxy-tetrahydrodipicolinate reductase
MKICHTLISGFNTMMILLTSNTIAFDRSIRRSLSMLHSGVSVMVNGMPGLMAQEVAKVCLDRGINLIDVGFTGPIDQQNLLINGKSSSKSIFLNQGPGINPNASLILRNLKEQYPDLIVVDYTHPTAILNNLKCYIENNVDFVMGTTGGDQSKMLEIFNKGSCSAVIAPNMAKQIVAVQSALAVISSKYPNSFSDYTLTVTESHQSSKADTSGTAKSIVADISKLIGKEYSFENIVKLRDYDNQIAFGVPQESLSGHAFHTYRLTSSDDSVTFELKHNVCGRRIYAEGTIDAVLFLDQVRKQTNNKRLYNMIDVLESGQMS